MKFFERLKARSEKIGSWVCVGLDVEPAKLPQCVRGESSPQEAFGRRIVEATADLTLCYKVNIAFYEAEGRAGYEALEKTLAAIPNDVPVILDAKRADIGNTSRQYARAAFDELGADAITVNPYLGQDSLLPFLECEEKGILILCATSNPGAKDFQFLQCEGEPLYEKVARKVADWNTRKNCGLVVGATHGEVFRRLRERAPELPFLVPGVGAQGGALEEVVRWGLTEKQVPPMINSSRGILYASSGEDFAEAARAATQNLRDAIRHAAQGC